MRRVARHLFAVRGVGRVFADRLDLDDAAQGAGRRLEQAEIGAAAACVGQFRRGLHGGVESATDRIEKVFERRAVRKLGGAAFGGVDLVETVQISFNGVHRDVLRAVFQG